MVMTMSSDIVVAVCLVLLVLLALGTTMRGK